jgi:hypothetical protein
VSTGNIFKDQGHFKNEKQISQVSILYKRTYSDKIVKTCATLCVKKEIIQTVFPQASLF